MTIFDNLCVENINLSFSKHSWTSYVTSLIPFDWELPHYWQLWQTMDSWVGQARMWDKQWIKGVNFYMDMIEYCLQYLNLKLTILCWLRNVQYKFSDHIAIIHHRIINVSEQAWVVIFKRYTISFFPWSDSCTLWKRSWGIWSCQCQFPSCSGSSATIRTFWVWQRGIRRPSRCLSVCGRTSCRISCRACGSWCGVYRRRVCLCSSIFVVINIIIEYYLPNIFKNTHTPSTQSCSPKHYYLL